MITYRMVEDCKSKWIGLGFTGNRECLKTGVIESETPVIGIAVTSSNDDFFKISFKLYKCVVFISMFSKVDFGNN